MNSNEILTNLLEELSNALYQFHSGNIQPIRLIKDGKVQTKYDGIESYIKLKEVIGNLITVYKAKQAELGDTGEKDGNN